MIDFPILTALIFLPVLGAVLCLLVPREEVRTVRLLALCTSLVGFAASLPLLWMYDASPGAAVFQLTETVEWVPSVGLGYSLGVDGMSLLLVILTTFLTPVGLLASFTSVREREKEFYASMLMLEAGVVGVFCAKDLILFYVFWEVVLLPMLLIIGVFGGKRRVYAATKFFIYTMVGSVLMLAAILYVSYRVWQATGQATFDIDTLRLHLGRLADLGGAGGLSIAEQCWLFAAFSLAFAIKVPLFPFHTWLPDAHTEAPTAGSVMLAAVLLKMGTYGFVRLAVPLFPKAAAYFAPWIAALAVLGIIYGALMALAQDDMKKLVAYSSVSHLGFVVLGIVAWNQEALAGAVYQMLGHGLSTGALFLVIGALYERRHTRMISDYGGVASMAPGIAVVYMIATLSSAGLPGLNGFVGEFLILLGTFQESPLAAACAALGVILGAVYLLTLYQRVMLGTPKEDAEPIEDLTAREWAYFVPVCALMVIMGLFPRPFLAKLRPALEALVHQVGPVLGG